jgi:hypothetical protein
MKMSFIRYKAFSRGILRLTWFANIQQAYELQMSAQGAQALICISVVCFSVYLFYECLYIAF